MLSILKSAQAPAKPNPTAHLAMFSADSGALLALCVLWHHEIKQEPFWAVAESLDPGASLSGFQPHSCYCLALSLWGMLFAFLGLNFLIGEQVSLPHRAFRIKCTDIGKELRQCLACTKSSINISIISAQWPFQTFKQRKLSEDKSEQTGVEMAL